jgi:UDP-N-acetylglucosamine kinase
METLMTDEEQAIEARAIAFAKANRTKIAREIACVHTYPGEDKPVSAFMAGSPGAGKTEVSKAFIEYITGLGVPTLRIDPDDFRDYFPEYTGGNSRLFQRGVNSIIERLHDLVLHQRQSFLLDGTLANTAVATRNVERSLQHNRFVTIIYVYQDPILAWDFVKAREITEGRNIPKSEFIRQLFAARETVLELKKRFRHLLPVDLIIKNNDGSNRRIELNADARTIDALVTVGYSASQLDQILTEA